MGAGSRSLLMPERTSSSAPTLTGATRRWPFTIQPPTLHLTTRRKAVAATYAPQEHVSTPLQPRLGLEPLVTLVVLGGTCQTVPLAEVLRILYLGAAADSVTPRLGTLGVACVGPAPFPCQ
jgi:hypothetical protein